jgi:hypothetical protein
MALEAFALAAMLMASTPTAAAPSGSGGSVPAQTQSQSARFEGRPEARIAFTNQVRNFQVKRENNDDILYLETSRDRWYRSEITCFGIADPRDAHGLIPLRSGGAVDGFDSFSRVALVGFSSQRTDCSLDRLIELTPQEAVDLRLIRSKAGRERAKAGN